MIFALHIHSRQISLQEPNEALMFPCDSERVAMLVMQCHVKDRVVPEFLRTLVFARPRGDDQFADCTFSPSLDMSR